jgi:hypothetical protein
MQRHKLMKVRQSRSVINAFTVSTRGSSGTIYRVVRTSVIYI